MAEEEDRRRGIYRRIYSNFVNGRRINSVSPEAEALFWRLHAMADDWGNLWGDPNLIKCHGAPRRSWTFEQVEAMVQELVNVCLVKPYQVDGESYLNIVGWEDMQPAGKNGKRFKRFPQCEDGQERVNPGESKIFLNNPSASSLSQPSHSHSHSQEHTHTQSPLPPKGESERVRKEKLPFLESDLRDIYAAYPRHEAPRKAQEAIGRALIRIHGRNGCEDCAAWMLERVKSYAASPAGKAGKFTPMPATWFNQDRFDDDPQTWNRNDTSKPEFREPLLAPPTPPITSGTTEYLNRTYDTIAAERKARIAKLASVSDVDYAAAQAVVMAKVPAPVREKLEQDTPRTGGMLDFNVCKELKL